MKTNNLDLTKWNGKIYGGKVKSIYLNNQKIEIDEDDVDFLNQYATDRKEAKESAEKQAEIDKERNDLIDLAANHFAPHKEWYVPTKEAISNTMKEIVLEAIDMEDEMGDYQIIVARHNGKLYDKACINAEGKLRMLTYGEDLQIIIDQYSKKK